MTIQRRVDFAAIKQAADFSQVLAHYEQAGELAMQGTKARGEQVMIHCPFHDDSQASLSINTAKGLFHCFNEGGCGAKGNVLDFVEKMEAEQGRTIPVREAAIVLAGICGITVDGPRNPSKPRRATKATKHTKARPEAKKRSEQPPAASEDGSSKEIEANNPLKPAFLEKFQASLKDDHPYLAERGLDAADVNRLGLGFQTAGGWKDRVVIPIHDHEGHILAYAGRWALGDECIPEGQGKYKLPARKHFRPDLALFNHHRAFERRHVTLVEGYFGAMALDLLGLPAVAVMGNSISLHQVELLKAFPKLKAITVMLDGGEHHRSSTDRMLGVIARRAPRFSVRAVELPFDEQPDTVDPAELADLYPALTRSLSAV